MRHYFVSTVFCTLPLMLLNCTAGDVAEESISESAASTANETEAATSVIKGEKVTTGATLDVGTTSGSPTNDSATALLTAVETDGSPTTAITTGEGSSIGTHAEDSTSTGPEAMGPCSPSCLAGACPEVVNVQTLGAVGDGQTDDYEALLDVATYAAAHPGVTLVFPKGSYRIDRYVINGGVEANDVKHVLFEGLDSVKLIGCSAKIDLKGDFHRGADIMEGDYWRSYSHWVIPFLISNSVNFLIEGFEIDGNAQLTTIDPGVVEGESYGVFARGSSDYILRDLDIHHMGTDGILLGGNAFVADKNAVVRDVVCSNNARQGMSVIQVRGLSVTNSRFLESGLTEGGYGGHSPKAGVDVEPSTAPPTVDVMTGGIVFEDCEFKGNEGAQFVAGYSNSTDDILIRNSQLIALSKYPYPLILAVKDGVIKDSVIDTHSGAILPKYAASPSAKTTIDNCTIYSSGNGIVSDNISPTPLLIKNSNLIGTHLSPTNVYMPYIQNTMCEFMNNHVFVPKEKFIDPVLVTVLLQNIALSSENHFSTDLAPDGNQHFAVSYSASQVINDHFDSGLAIRPYGVAMFDPSEPYSQP